MERSYWTDRSSFAIEEALEPFFQDALDRGYRPYRDGDFDLAFGLCNGRNRQIDFYHRGGATRRRGPLLEVLLADSDKYIRLGPYFGLEESACVVVNGYDDAREVCYNWLDGVDLAPLLAGTQFLKRTDLSELLVAN